MMKSIIASGEPVLNARLLAGSRLRGMRGLFVVGLWLVSSSIAHGQPVTAPSSTTYNYGDTVTISFSGFPGTAQDWIALATPGSPGNSYFTRLFTGGQTSGSVSFLTVAPGNYVARGFQGNATTPLVQSAAFFMATASSGWWPDGFSDAPLGTAFVWPDTGAATYGFHVRHPTAAEGCGTQFPAPPTGCDSGVANMILNRATVCAANSVCVLEPGMSGYPSLESRVYKWTVTVPGWTFRTFYVLPRIPGWASATWKGDTLELSWGSATAAASYRADIGHVFTKDYTENSTCSTATCSATSDVKHIKFGTIFAAIRSCGTHGRCTPDGMKTEAYRAPPTPVEAADIAFPLANATVSGGVTIAWIDAANIERWSIRLEKDTGGAQMQTVSDESPWRPTVACGLGFCSRPYVLTPGSYLATVAAYSGATWSASRTSAFSVDVSGVTPTMLSPKGGQSTSIYPMLVWKKVPGVNSYVLTVNYGGTSTEKYVSCRTELCSYDLLKANWALVPGVYEWSVRVNVPGMPLGPATTFAASYSYVPPAPTIATPVHKGSVGLAQNVTAVFFADVQVPAFTVVIEHPSGNHHTSARLDRPTSGCSLVLVGGELKQSCAYSTLAFCNQSDIRIRTHTFANASGGTSSPSESARHLFTRNCFEESSTAKATYTIFAQNAQFLYVPVAGEPVDVVYNMSAHHRAAALIQYMNDNQFDVVALSEMLNPEAQDLLGRSLPPTYDKGVMVGRIDTAGDPLFTIREGFPYEAVSGLAIYSKFKAVPLPATWNSNSQCTDDLFNQVSETYTTGTTTPIPLNDNLWFNQYCEAEGMDALAGKGFAAIRLENPVTGVPLVIGWSHTQAMTDQGPTTEAGLPVPNDYSYKDSYEKRDSQLKEARDSINHIIGTLPTVFDAFILGDWNTPQPQSVSGVPTWDGTTETAGRPNLAAGANPLDPLALYNSACASGCGDPKNPSFASLVGEYDPTPDNWRSQNLYSQYWSAFDPRNASRYFPAFYDLWLEQPAGDWGLTFDRTHAPARCDERGEPCHGNNPQGFDRGQRYDIVLARLHASVMPNHRNSGSYPANGTAFANKQACVQHVRLAKDYRLSDHFGTIIEVGPEADFCSPMRARAEAQNRIVGAPPNYVPPNNDDTHHKYRGVHDGKFAHGGANEWLYISEAGGYDFVHEGGLPVWIEAYDPKDLSTPMSVADSTQTQKGVLGKNELCNWEMNATHIEQFGYIAPECARSESRVTYKSPGPFFARVYPVHPDGSRCVTCTGTYRIRIRARTCKVAYDAVPTFPGLVNPQTDGWFGPGQRQCWFSTELREPTLAADFQTFTLGDLMTANASRCANAGGPGTCSSEYVARLYHKVVRDLPLQPHELPPVQAMIAGPFTHNATTNGTDILTDASWEVSEFARENGKAKGDYRSQYLWVVQRSDSSRKHEFVLPWVTNLKSVTFSTATAIEIDDDDKIICIPTPFGCVPIKDPFQDEDEVIVRIHVNSLPAFFEQPRDMKKKAVFEFPNTWPGASSQNEPGVYRQGGDGSPRGFTINFTGSANVRAEEDDDDSDNDSLIADHIMVGVPTPGSGQDKQTNQITSFKIDQPDLREVPFVWDFTDSGWDAPLFGQGIPVAGYKVHYRLAGRILRDQ
jgi:hypothetical protein